MIAFRDLNMTFETKGGYKSTINGKVELPYHTFKIMVRYQLINFHRDDKLYLFCYKYSVWMVWHIINFCIGAATITPWSKEKYKINIL